MRKLIISSVLPPAIVALFACFSFYLVNMSIVRKNVDTTVDAAIYKLKGDIQGILQPTIDKMSNWQAIVKEIHDEAALSRIVRDDEKTLFHVMKGISSDLSEDTMFYYATLISRFKRGGFFINSVGWVPDPDWEPSSRGWFKDAVANKGQFTYTEPYVDDRTGKLCATFSQSIDDNRGRVIGVAAMDVMLDELSQVVLDTKVSEHSNVYILLSDGRYLTNPDSSKIMSENYFTGKRAADLKMAGYKMEDFFDGEEKSFVYKDSFYAVSRIGSSPWFVMVDGVISDFSAVFIHKLIIILCILLVLGGGSAVVNVWILGSMRKKERGLAGRLLSETQNLAVASKENAATSQDQNVAVKEVVATMEDNTTLSENISEKIKGVSGIAAKTSGDVAEGVAFLSENVRQLHEIATANKTTIEGIKALGEKIENIWDIVTLINNVADQAKIIAFNAELEASSAGEAGRSFHIVATEIRRLADGIIDGTKEIKERITEIQQSSDSLILTSESGTEKIQEGVENAKNLEERFSSIKNASEVTANSAGDITTIIQQQAVASEQILITLKQIASGVENFTVATEHISKASQNLKSIATDLSGSDDSSQLEE